MQHQPRAERQDFEIAFSGLRYPASRDAILSHANDHGGLDREVVTMLEQPPDREYRTQGDLQATLSDIYREHDVPPDMIPI